MMRLTLYVDEDYGMPQLASSCQNMTGLEMTFFVNLPVYNFIYMVLNGFLHHDTLIHETLPSAVPSKTILTETHKDDR